MIGPGFGSINPGALVTILTSPFHTYRPTVAPPTVGCSWRSTVIDLAFKHLSRPICLVVTGSFSIIVLAASLHAGIGGFGNNRAIGGVMIDASGVVRTATAQEQTDWAAIVRQRTVEMVGDLNEAAELRMVSLKGLQQAVADSKQAGEVLPSEVEFLAGLQRIEYVFVDDERQDIVIAGPAEPWTVRDDGSVVGKVSGGATMRLADLLVAFQSLEDAQREGISCSIEPTAEGRRRLQQFLRRVKLRPGQNPAVFESSMKEAFGPQTIQLIGVDTETRYARTLVAADYQMKRLAMALMPSPVKGLPSYLDMSKNSRQSANQNPRWWMACNYDALVKSEDGMSWKLSGQGVKTLTEQDIVQDDGTVQGTGKSDKLAQQWAAKMTDSFTELSKEISVFADLQNLMDLTVVATLITQEDLDDAAGLDLSVLKGQADAVQLTSYEVPKAVDPQCSFVRGRTGWTVTASGGVRIDADEVIRNQKSDNAVSETRATSLAANEAKSWWWNQK